MLSRKRCLVTVAAMSLAVSGVTLVRAEDKMPDDTKIQQKIEEQDKEKADLMANYTDPGFVKIASMANKDEIKAGEAALEKTKNTDVHSFAQMMVDDHGKVGEEMKGLAEKKGWIVHDTMDAKHKLATAEMAKLNGADFDKAYVTGQVKDHEDAIALFKLASDKTSDSDLKDWVNKTLPNLEHHLKMAKSLEDKLGATADAR